MTILSAIKHSCRSIGIDPGLANTGYAVIGTLAKGGDLCGCGSVKTSGKLSLQQRLQVIYQEVDKLLKKWQPVIMVIEDVYVMDRFPNAAIQLGEVRGVIYLAAEDNSVEVIKISPAEAKSCLTGNGRATKGQVSSSVKRILGISENIKPDHASDAAALAIIGLSRKGFYVF